MIYKTTLLKPFGVLVEPTEKDVLVEQLNIEELKMLFKEHQLIVLRNFKSFSKASELSEYCERWGEVSVWPFGKVLELKEQDNPQDHIFDSSYVPLHWDGMYREQVPEYQIFQCIEAPLSGNGGRTTFSNTALALKNISSKQRELWSKVIGTYKRKMEFYNSRIISPIITKHPFRDYPVIRYNEFPTQEKGKFINPPDLEFQGLTACEFEDFHTDLLNSLYAPEVFYAHEWESGDVVIADNFTLLHGREKFTSKSPRHLRRVQVLSDSPLENIGLESYE